jgi:hypothetical protein
MSVMRGRPKREKRGIERDCEKARQEAALKEVEFKTKLREYVNKRLGLNWTEDEWSCTEDEADDYEDFEILKKRYQHEKDFYEKVFRMIDLMNIK